MNLKKFKATVGAALLLALLFATATAANADSGSGESSRQTAEKGRVTRQESLIDSFAPFRPYGLTYDAKLDQVFWNEQEVKAFVDLRETIPGGGYSFNLGYIDSHSDSTLFCMAAHDAQGSVTGIEPMPEELKNDLYGAYQQSLTTEACAPDLEQEIKGNLSKLPGAAGDLYVTFDGTTHLTDAKITASDKFELADLPQDVLDWILACDGSETVNVKRKQTDDQIDVWVYYDRGTRLAWNMNAVGTIVTLTLTDSTPESIPGATILHYQAPNSFLDLEVFYQNEKLSISEQ